MYKDDIVQWIREWFEVNGPNSPAVIGISGGVDSSVVAALCVKALGKERVIGILLPNGDQADIGDSIDLVKHLEIRHATFNISETFKSYGIFGLVDAEFNPETMALARGNTEARIRMTYLYGLSQTLGGRVSNNCNKSEIFVGYSTRWGDDTGDFAPLRDLTKAEVFALAQELDLPQHLATKTPIDGLDNNKIDGRDQTDEDNMGFSYIQLDKYIKFGGTGSPSVDARIEAKHKASEFKRVPIAQYTKERTI